MRAAAIAALLLVAFYAGTVQLMGARDIGRMLAGFTHENADNRLERRLQAPCDISGDYEYNGQGGFVIEQTGSVIHIIWPSVAGGFEGQVDSSCAGTVAFGGTSLTYTSSGTEVLFENGIRFSKIGSSPTPTPPGGVMTPQPTAVVVTPQPTPATPTPTTLRTPTPSAPLATEPTPPASPQPSPQPTLGRHCYIQNKHYASVCLDAADRKLKVQDCDDANQDQHWVYTARINRIKLFSGQCLEMTGASHNANILMADCDETKAEQRWRFTKGRIRGGTPETRKFCVDAIQRRPSDKVKLRDCNKVKKGQRWRLVNA